MLNGVGPRCPSIQVATPVLILLGQGESLTWSQFLRLEDTPARFQNVLDEAPSQSFPTMACMFAEVETARRLRTGL